MFAAEPTEKVFTLSHIIQVTTLLGRTWLGTIALIASEDSAIMRNVDGFVFMFTTKQTENG